MNTRKLSILVSCLGLSAMVFGCGDDYVSGYVGELLVCDPTVQQSRCDAEGNMEICALTQWNKVECQTGCKDGICVTPEGSECAVTMCDIDGIHLNECVGGKITKKDCSANGQVCLGNVCGDKPNIVECKEDQIKCVDSSDNKYLTCSKDGTWLADEKTCDGGQVCRTADGKAQCVSTTELETCTADACTDGQIRVCTDGYYEDAQDCPSKACASESTCAPIEEPPVVEPEKDCNEGDKKCSEDNKGIITCTADGTWGEVVPCETEGYVCDATLTCVAPDAAVECVTDQMRCTDNASYKTCVEGKWSEATTKCADETPVCNVDKCEATTVEPPVMTCKAVCENGKIKECDADGNLKAAADCANGGTCEMDGDVAVCKVAENTNPLSCKPGAFQCGVNAKLYQLCKDDGTWGESQACEDPKVCDPESSEICVAQCTVGAERCADGVHQICNGQGAWIDDPCEASDTCNAETGACVCTENATKCEENERGQVVLKTCQANGTWDRGEQCNNGQFCDTAENKCVDNCKTGDERCTAEGVHQICRYNNQSRSYYWQDNPCAASDTCKAETGACVCTAGATKCITSDGFNPEILIATCQEDGTWNNGERCANNHVCDPMSGTCVPPCTDGEVKCEGASFMQCSDGIWAELTHCGAADKCSATGDVIGCNCTPKSTICIGDDIMECRDLQAGNIFDPDRLSYRGYASTENTTTCDAGMCKTDAQGAYCACAASYASCESNGYQNSSTLSYCTAAGKIATVECGRNSTCNETLVACIAGNDAVCTGSGKSCLNNNVVTCSDGIYVVDEACGTKVCTERYGNVSCQEANANETCQNNQNNQTRCATDMKSIEKCSNRRWTADSTCKDTEICVETTSGYGSTASCKTKVCDEMAMGCGTGDKANVIQICSDNAWSDIATCAEGMTCLAGSCVVK